MRERMPQETRRLGFHEVTSYIATEFSGYNAESDSKKCQFGYSVNSISRSQISFLFAAQYICGQLKGFTCAVDDCHTTEISLMFQPCFAPQVHSRKLISIFRKALRCNWPFEIQLCQITTKLWQQAHIKFKKILTFNIVEGNVIIKKYKINPNICFPFVNGEI